MKHAIRRVVVAAALLLAVTASPAAASGGADLDNGLMQGVITNLTPYTLTLADKGWPECSADPGNACGVVEDMPQKLLPGQDWIYTLWTWRIAHGALPRADRAEYAAWVTYKAEVAGRRST
jgi:hypothetical protein